MSDMNTTAVDATPVESSAPASTLDTATATMERLESDASEAAEASEPPATVEATVTSPPEATPAIQVSEVDALLQEAGYTEDRRPDGRENRIPYSKVKRIIENGLKKGRADFDTTRQTLETERTTLQGQLESFTALGELMQGDPEAFVRLMAQHDDRYGRFIQAQAPAQAPPPLAEMPQPDVPLPDGSRTYSLAGIQKLLEWNTQQTLQQADAKIQDRLKPLTDAQQREQQRIEREQAQGAMRTKVQQTIAEARTWPGFAEQESAVLQLLQADTQAAKAAGRRPTMTLKEAYQQVRIDQLSASANETRAKVLKELTGAPASTAVARTGAELVKPGGRSTQEIAAATLARMERG